MKTAIDRLVAAIGYPDGDPAGAHGRTLRVDGMEIEAEEHDGGIVLSYVLGGEESLLPTLAEYAAGRMLKESATLAWDADGRIAESGGEGRAILWQDAPATADAHELVGFFETFMDSCDWWRARVEALRVNEAALPDEALVIRP